jgi:ketosteroid isomerase-like protein
VLDAPLVSLADDVVAAAQRRARALAERDAETLLALHHPDLRWTTFRGDVLDRESYVRGNTEGELVWRAQRLEDVEVHAAADAAVLTAVVVDEVERAGARETYRLRLTQTWVRGADGWVCLAGHAGPQL